jgi:hypothetical protein
VQRRLRETRLRAHEGHLYVVKTWKGAITPHSAEPTPPSCKCTGHGLREGGGGGCHMRKHTRTQYKTGTWPRGIRTCGAGWLDGAVAAYVRCGRRTWGFGCTRGRAGFPPSQTGRGRGRRSRRRAGACGPRRGPWSSTTTWSNGRGESERHSSSNRFHSEDSTSTFKRSRCVWPRSAMRLCKSCEGLGGVRV